MAPLSEKLLEARALLIKICVALVEQYGYPHGQNNKIKHIRRKLTHVTLNEGSLEISYADGKAIINLERPESFWIQDFGYRPPLPKDIEAIMQAVAELAEQLKQEAQEKAESDWSLDQLNQLYQQVTLPKNGSVPSHT